MSSVLELNVEAGRWDQGLKKARNSLNRFIEANGGLQKSLEKDSDKIGKFVGMMGKVDSSSTTARGKMNDYKATVEQLTLQYNQLNESQKKTIGPSYLKAIEEQSKKWKEVKQQVEQVNNTLGDTKAPDRKSFMLSGMGGIGGGIASVAARYMGVTAVLGTIAGAFKNNIETAKGFEKSMSQLSSLTGKTGNELNKLKDYAIELGSKTTLSASQVADAFRTIGSQQPQLLASGEALKSVTQNAITLSEAAGIELATAAQTLSTSINQFGGDSSRASEFVNVLAAASQKGAGDIAWLGEAITKSGTTAKAVNTSYQELVANLEMLAKAGYDASTAGTALRSIIMSLEKQGNNDFKPSVVGLTQAFKNLNDAQLSLTQYQDITGKMFAAQAKALAENAAEAGQLREAITGTNIAIEQARTNTSNLDGSLKSLGSAWEGLNLHINNSNGFLKSAVDWLKDVVVWADQAFTSAGRAQKRLQELNGGGTEGTSSRTEQELSHLKVAGNRGQQWKYFNMVRDAYNEQIQSLKDDMSKVSESSRTWERLNIDVQSYKNMRDEFVNSGLQYMDSTDPNKALPKEETIKVTVDDEEAVESLSGLKARLKELRKLRDLSIENADYGARDDYNNEIKELQARIKELQGTTAQTVKDVYVPVEGSIDHMSKLVGELQKQFNATAEESVRGNLLVQLERANMVVASMREGMSFTLERATDIPSFSDQAKTFDYKGATIEKSEGGMSDDNIVADKKEGSMMDKLSNGLSGLSNITSGLKQMGIEIPESISSLIGVLQGVSSIVGGVSSIIQTFGMTATTGNTVALGINTAAITALTAAVTTNTATRFIIPFFSNGGVVHAADGLTVPGNSLSGDRVPAMVNSGEVILNRAQQGSLVSDLQQASDNNQRVLVSEIKGEKFIVLLDRVGRRTGRGELAFWKD